MAKFQKPKKKKERRLKKKALTEEELAALEAEAAARGAPRQRLCPILTPFVLPSLPSRPTDDFLCVARACARPHPMGLAASAALRLAEGVAHLPLDHSRDHCQSISAAGGSDLGSRASREQRAKEREAAAAAAAAEKRARCGSRCPRLLLRLSLGAARALHRPARARPSPIPA
jgi:hypothetical protein